MNIRIVNGCMSLHAQITMTSITSSPSQLSYQQMLLIWRMARLLQSVVSLWPDSMDFTASFAATTRPGPTTLCFSELLLDRHSKGFQ